MSYTLYVLGGTIAMAWTLWALYVFTMGIYRLKLSNNLKGINLFFAYPVVFLAVVTDFLVNVVIGTVLFLDPPRELLLTARLQRYMRGGAPWRTKLAMHICDHLLDMFDPRGKHC